MRLFAISTAMLFIASPCIARTADCLFLVEGKTVIDGRCNYMPTSGDFQITAPQSFSRAYLERNSNGSHSLSWDKGSGSGIQQLGIAFQAGACWSAKNSTLCVWKPGETRYFIGGIEPPDAGGDTPIPKSDVDALCSAAFKSPYHKDKCVEEEQLAYDDLRGMWERVSVKGRLDCIRRAPKISYGLYSVLNSCIASTLRVEEFYSKNPPRKFQP